MPYPYPWDNVKDPLAIPPGMLRHQVQFVRRNPQKDGYGQSLPQWQTYMTCLVAIFQLSGQELFQAEEFSSAAQYRIVLRWPGSAVEINVGDRILYGSRAFVIQIPNNVQLRNKKLELMCLEINGES